MSEQLPELNFNIGTMDEEQGKRTVISLPKNTSYFRVLPPFGTEHGGALFHHYSLHWGFVGPKGTKRPVSCSYPTEGYCPVCDLVFKKKNEQKRADANGDEALSKEIGAYIYEHSNKRTFYYNMVGMDGQVVVVQMPKTAHDALRTKIVEAVYERKFDPTSLTNGVWFKFDKTGAGKDTKYSVDFKKKFIDVEGQQAEVLDRSALAPELVETITRQLKSGAPGPMKDIHVMHELKSSSDLRALMNGAPVTKKVEGEALKADAPAVEAPKSPIGAGEIDVAALSAELARLRGLQEQAKTEPTKA